MGWASGRELAEQVWEIVSPHLDIDELQNVAQQIVEAFEDHDADDWCGSTLWEAAYPFGEGMFVPLLEEFDDEYDEEGSARVTEKGKATVKMVIQAANRAQCSILDVIQCCINEGGENTNDLDAMCLDILSGINFGHPLVSFTYNNPPTEFPEAEKEENEFFYMVVLLCAYTFGSAFEPGGLMEGEDFREFLSERPED